MIIFFYGENSFRAKEKIEELRDKFCREIDPSGQNFISLEGTKTELKELDATLSTGSLFVRKKMILIEDLLGNKKPTLLEEFLKYLEEKNLIAGEDIIIFYEPRLKMQKGKLLKSLSDKDVPLGVKEKKFFDFLLSQKYAQEMKSLSNLELSTWAKKEMEKNSQKISPAALNYLVALVEGNMWQLKNEIEKLSQLKNQTEISLEEVKALVSGKFDTNIFNLTDAWGSRNKNSAMKILEEQLEVGVSEEYLLSMIRRQFKIILEVKEALSLGVPIPKIALELKLNPFVAKKAIDQARHFSLEESKIILKKLSLLDKENKSGQRDLKTGLSLLLARF